MCFADLVKDVKFRPRYSNVEVGDEIKCHVRGNPTPRISIKPNMASELDGPGWKSFRVPAEFEGKDLAVVCTATNEVGDVSETVSKNRTFHVAGEFAILWVCVVSSVVDCLHCRPVLTITVYAYFFLHSESVKCSLVICLQ